jgi:hypothetical protein
MNVVGGYVVTDRMLQMFRRREQPRAASVKGEEAAAAPAPVPGQQPGS